MFTRANVLWAFLVIAVLVTTGATLGTAVAQKASPPTPVDKLTLGEDEVVQLLLL